MTQPQGYHGLAGWKGIGIALAVVVVALIPGWAVAESDDAALERAFAAGLEGAATDGLRLNLRRAGTSLELSAPGEDGAELRLTCLLCTAAEQEARARALGALVAGIDETGEDAGSPPLASLARTDGRKTARWPLLAGGVGLAAAAAGVVLLVFDGGCASPVRDAAGNCAALHHLAPAGWTLAGTGAAAVLAAVLWWLLDVNGSPGWSEEVYP